MPGRPRSALSEQSALSAAATLFSTLGYMATTMEAIARHAGVGKQTLYRRWPGKAHLAAAVYETIVPRQEIETDTGSLHGDIKTMVSALFDFYQEGPASAILAGLISEAQAGSNGAETLRSAFFDSRKQTTVALFSRALNRGDLRPGADPDLLSDLLIGAIWTRLLVRHAPLDDTFAIALADHFDCKITETGKRQ